MAYNMVRPILDKAKARIQGRLFSVMANWGANHGVTIGGHVGADLITNVLNAPVSP